MGSRAKHYQEFKEQVLKNADYECEICHTSDGLTVHHLLKQSTYPQYRTDPINGVCLCGVCHSEIERRLRQNEPIDKFLHRRLCRAYEHFGVSWKQLGVECEFVEDIDD